MNGKVSGDCATSRFPFNESTQHSDGEGSSEGLFGCGGQVLHV